MIASGRARDTFREVVRLQGGDPAIVDDPARLPHAAQVAHVSASRAGIVTAICCEQVGIASMMLGGGRERKEDTVDPALGLVLRAKVGDALERGATLCDVHYNRSSQLANAMNLLAESFEIGDKPPRVSQLVRKVIGA
jgi:pyrimidine-nucleoside phosphorylase